MKAWWMLLLIVSLGPIVGCEADGEIDVDDDDAEMRIDVDD
jgi:hypothetical protein